MKDKDDWGSSFGADPDWADKKIKSLEESLILAKKQRDRFELMLQILRAYVGEEKWKVLFGSNFEQSR